MRDALGGAMIIQLIIIFLLIINAYLAFTVNYTKAFRVKNGIISIVERNEGLNEQAKQQIESLMSKSTYSVSRDYINKCGSGNLKGYQPQSNKHGGFCYKVTLIDKTGGTAGNQKYQGTEYSITTFVSLDIPVLNKIFPIFAEAFAIKGETKTIYSSGNNSELS